MQSSNIAIFEDALQKVENKYQLDVIINKLLEMIEYGKIPNHFPSSLQELFRDKIEAFVFSQGDIVDRLYLSLYVVFKDALISERFLSIETLAQKHLFAPDMGDHENLLLIELATLAKILGGKADEGLAFYIQKIVVLDIHHLESQKNAQFILEAFKYFKIPFEFLKENLLLVLQRDFSKLTYKQKRSVFNWQLHVFWNVEHYFNHRGWLELAVIWKDIFYQELQILDSQSMDFALYVHFFIYHLCGNNFASQEEWKQFNTQITLHAMKFYEKFAQNFHLPKAKATQSGVIGILRDRLVENSPYKVEISFLESLMQDREFSQKYRIKLYVMSLLEKSDNQANVLKSYEDLGIEVIDIGMEHNHAGYYNSHLAKALSLRQRIQEDEVEFLISPNNGYGISDFLLATRTSLKQIFWSHGNFVYDMPMIDLKITHICGNQAQISHQDFLFNGIPTRMQDRFYHPKIDAKILQNVRSLYPQDAYILGNIGRLVKIDDQEYLACIIEILKEHPNTIFLACGAGNQEEIKAKIKAIDEAMLSRFFFPGYVDSAIYGYVIDLWLDSFPMQQGESRIEFSAKGRPSLVLSKEEKEARRERLKLWFDAHQESILSIISEHGMHLERMLEFLCDDVFVAFDTKDYLAKASNLITMSPQQLKEYMFLQHLMKQVYDLIRETKGRMLFLASLQSL